MRIRVSGIVIVFFSLLLSAGGEGTDGAEGCFGLLQLVRGARLMYTGYSNDDTHTLSGYGLRFVRTPELLAQLQQ